MPTAILVLTGGRAVAFGGPRETLTAALLKEVFQVESVRLDAPGVSLDIPWSVDSGR